MKTMTFKGSIYHKRIKLLGACIEAEKFLTEQMNEAEQLEHELDPHEPDTCVLCILREAIRFDRTGKQEAD